MRIVIILLALLLLTGTTSAARPDSADTGPIDTSHTILIELDEDISLHWDTTTSMIVQDSLLLSLMERADSIGDRLIELITDDREIAETPCLPEGKIRAGSIAFLLLSRLFSLPYAKTLGMQFCLISFECPYPLGLLDAIQNYPLKIQSRLRNHFRTPDVSRR